MQRALAIQEQALSPTHPSVANSLNSLALLYQAQGRYPEAEPLLQRALAIREQALSPTHPSVANSLHNLAGLYDAQGKYAQAEPLLQRALAIQEQVLGPTHPDVAASLNTLAELYRLQGRYPEVEPLLQRALAIREQALSPTHPDVATSLHNLAGLYQAQGRYPEAEPLLQRALAIREQALSPTHPDVATSLHNLAELYRLQGQYAQAEPLCQRALAILEQALGSSHHAVAAGLNTLAGLYQAQGQYAQAEPLLQRALTIVEQALGPRHRYVAAGLTNLAVFYMDQEQYAQAEPLLQRALTIQEQALGPSHPDVATNLNNLAWLYFDREQYTQVESLFRRALTIREQALGPSHPDVATSLTNLAVLAWAQGDIAHAVPLLTRSSAIHDHMLTLMLTLGTEAQKLASATLLSWEISGLLSFHTHAAPHDPQALRLALTTILRRKGRVLDTMSETLATLRRQVQPADQQLLAQWAAVRGALATLVWRGLGAQSPEAYRIHLAQLEAQGQQLEAQLSARSAAFRAQTHPPTLEQVQAALPAGTVLVELAVYAPYTPPQQRGPSRYVAYVLPPQGEPTWVDLGEAAPIDQAVADFRTALSSLHPLRHVQEAARTLDALVLQPLRPLLGTARHLLLSPDGALQLVPFGALVDESGAYLLQHFTVSYLTTGRDLLRPASPRPTPQLPLVVGNPAFTPPRPSLLSQAATALSSLLPRRSMDAQALFFSPLPGTAQEVAAVHRLLPKSRLWTKAAASEGALKQVQGPRLLHLSTHGFFLADQPATPPATPPLQVVSATPAAEGSGRPLENPLLRSGLALAEANAPQPGQEDGLLTALEVAGLDLWGTELVVLSACDTGVGSVRTGEGVYGLRRALVMAGAASQLMSLWKVDDEATRELMVAYYGRLRAGEGRAEALRQVQLRMLATPQRRHPFYWAAFILSGAWTPLAQR